MAMPQGERLGDTLCGVLVNADDHDVARHRAGMPYPQLPELGVEEFQVPALHEFEPADRNGGQQHEDKCREPEAGSVDPIGESIHGLIAECVIGGGGLDRLMRATRRHNGR